MIYEQISDNNSRGIILFRLPILEMANVSLSSCLSCPGHAFVSFVVECKLCESRECVCFVHLLGVLHGALRW